MGMYTELHFNVQLKEDVPAEVVSVLQWMLDNKLEKPNELSDHELFKTDRFSFMFTTDSYYFAADTHSTFRYDDISNRYHLCIQCNLKNYDSEIAKFLDWIMPYVDANEGDFLGYSRYEEEQDPTLIHYIPRWKKSE